MTRRTMVIDLDRCTGCQSCIVACKFENNVTLGNYRNDVVDIIQGEHPDVSMYWVPLRCQQCEDSPCVQVCPTGASYRDEDNGVVLVDSTLCIGCKSCLTACPYSDESGQTRPSVRWLNVDTNVIEKCTLCNHLTATSDGVENERDTFDPAHAVPPCVHNCPTKALHFGDLDDENSEAAQYLAQAQADGRGVHTIEAEGATPTTQFILSDSIATWNGITDGIIPHANS